MWSDSKLLVDWSKRHNVAHKFLMAGVTEENTHIHGEPSPTTQTVRQWLWVTLAYSRTIKIKIKTPDAKFYFLYTFSFFSHESATLKRHVLIIKQT